MTNLTPNIIDVFAFVPPVGTGNEYAWVGQIHRAIEYTVLDTARVPMYVGGALHFSHEDLSKVAKNLASMIMTHPSSEHNAAKVPAYKLNYNSVGLLGKIISKGRQRNLSPFEQALFSDVFAETIFRR